jgi:hypothetical protein
MHEEYWGVFFEDSGTTYLVAVESTEHDAIDEAERRDEQAFDFAVERYAEEDEPDYPEPVPEDFEGMHDIAEIEREFAGHAEDLLARNIAVQVR